MTSPAKREYRAIVLGLGGVGSAAMYWLSRTLGDDVLGLEQFEFGHANGGSEDHSRIIRLSYHTPGYVALAKAAYLAWETLEVESGEQVVLRTGGLDLAPPGASIGLDDYRSSMTVEGVAYQELEAAEIMRTWPQWRLEEDVVGIFQEKSGIAMASRANATHRRRASLNGAALLDGVGVVSITDSGGEVVVETALGSYRTENLVIAAGAWTNRMLGHLGVAFPLEVTLEQVVYLETSMARSFHPSRFPVWIWMDEPCLYGFPIFGEPAVKVGWDRCEVVTDTETRRFEPREDVTREVARFLSRHLPGVDGEVRLAKTCLYTLTPDRDFIIGPVPGHERVVVAVGAGHAFKFASLIGRTLAELVVDGAALVDIEPFAPTRPILREAKPARSYMV